MISRLTDQIIIILFVIMILIASLKLINIHINLLKIRIKFKNTSLQKTGKSISEVQQQIQYEHNISLKLGIYKVTRKAIFTSLIILSILLLTVIIIILTNLNNNIGRISLILFLLIVLIVQKFSSFTIRLIWENIKIYFPVELTDFVIENQQLVDKSQNFFSITILLFVVIEFFYYLFKKILLKQLGVLIRFFKYYFLTITLR